MLWDRHVSDCLQLLPLLPPCGPLVDLGTGAGFPGLVLAIASERPFHLIEADHRKAAFLREAARVAKADVHVHATRIETARLPPMQLVTARAVAALPQLLAWSMPLLAPSGQCLFMKGGEAEIELTQAAAKWTMQVTSWQSQTKPTARILQISSLSSHALS